MSTAPGTGRATQFGRLLRNHRLAGGLTQEELAERAELSVRGLRYVEKGLRRPTRDTAAVRWALGGTARSAWRAGPPRTRAAGGSGRCRWDSR